MNPDLRAKIDRRRLFTMLAGGSAVLLSDAATAAPERVFRFAAPGNAVIITNTGLIEIDPGLPRVEELVRRVDHVLRTRRVLDHIARTQSRLFALGSVTLNGPPSERLIWDFQTTLDDQSEFVPRNFGPLAIDDLPLHIATSLYDDREGFDAVLNTICYITKKSGFWRDAKITRVSGVFSMTDTARSAIGALNLITLWPFHKTGSNGKSAECY
jgi:hypothetical protein